MNNLRYYPVKTNPYQKNLQLNIFSKVDPRSDGMLDSLSVEQTEIPYNKNVNYYTAKRNSNQIIRRNSISSKISNSQKNRRNSFPSSKNNNSQIINRKINPPLKNNFYNQNYKNDFNSSNSGRSRNGYNGNENFNGIYYGPYDRNSFNQNLANYKGKDAPIIKFRSCLKDNDICGLF